MCACARQRACVQAYVRTFVRVCVHVVYKNVCLQKQEIIVAFGQHMNALDYSIDR